MEEKSPKQKLLNNKLGQTNSEKDYENLIIKLKDIKDTLTKFKNIFSSR